ncbi:DNA-directed RNA polymerase subunit RPB3/RPB11 [uncultured virus]|nr:DNA-directed RNA polymerase subunit RPB3/RPB11 [uncultured virus]
MTTYPTDQDKFLRTYPNIDPSNLAAINVQVIHRIILEHPADNEPTLILAFSGVNMDHTIVNAIKRCIYLYVPVYRFHKSNMHIDINKTRGVHNFDHLHYMISCIPVYDIPITKSIYSPSAYMSNPILKQMFQTHFDVRSIQADDTTDDNTTNTATDLDAGILPNEMTEHKIEVFMSVVNNTTKDTFASTHDLILHINGQPSNNYKSANTTMDHTNKPITIQRKRFDLIPLRPGDSVTFKATANVSISRLIPYFETTTSIGIEHKDDGSFVLKYESLGQTHPVTIYNTAIDILVIKLQGLGKFLEFNKPDYIAKAMSTNTSKFNITIRGEEDTLGNMLTMTLQRNPNIEFAGYALDKPGGNLLELVVAAKQLNKTLDIIIEAIRYLVALLNKLVLPTP